MDSSVKYPIVIQDFESLRTLGFLYVDKTDILYHLTQFHKYIFLSRPRRFGKSLTLFTLRAYFEDKKNLFTGIAMEKLEKDWIEYPELLGSKVFKIGASFSSRTRRLRNWKIA